LFGAGGFGVGALASALAGALQNGSARPMAFVIAACLLGCATSLYGLALPRKIAQAA
jgi:DHA1 family bicyclomycin/chloramphenicol resistance-like MFS transporter